MQVYSVHYSHDHPMNKIIFCVSAAMSHMDSTTLHEWGKAREASIGHICRQ
jgi:hypothetical protein